MQQTIRHQWFFPHPPSLVWDYLTKPELLAQWLMENDFQPIVGHEFKFHAKPKIKLGFDGAIYCKVLEVMPFTRLSYSWKGGKGPENISLDSVVTWTLTPKHNGTVLLLEHTGFKGVRNYIPWLIMNKGWAKIGKRLLKNIGNLKYDKTTL